jgi:hypothetical protein
LNSFLLRNIVEEAVEEEDVDAAEEDDEAVLEGEKEGPCIMSALLFKP